MNNHEGRPKEKGGVEVEETGLTFTEQELRRATKTVPFFEHFLIENGMKEGGDYAINVDGKRQILKVEDTLVTISDENGNTLWKSTKRSGLSQYVEKAEN